MSALDSIKAVNSRVDSLSEILASRISDLNTGDSIQAMSSRLESMQKVLDSQITFNEILIIALAVISAVGFLVFASYSRKAVFDLAEDKDRIAEFAMKQTFGLPQGTVRGIMAILVAIVFLGSIFIFGDGTPETVKIITALVFGYYFAKSSDQSKDLLEAMLGKTSQKAVRRQEAVLAISEARSDGAGSYASAELAQAQNILAEGDQKQSASDAIELYKNTVVEAQNARQKALQAKEDAVHAERSEQQKKEKENQSQFKEDSNRTRIRIDELIALDIDHRAILGIWETAGEQAETGEYADANQTLSRVESMADVLLKEYDEAKEIYEQKLQDAQRRDLQEAKDALDSDESLKEAGADGKKIVEALLAVLGHVKDHNPDLLPLLRKRVMGQEFERADLQQIFSVLEEEGQTKVLNNVVDIAANSVGQLLPEKFTRV